MPEPAVLIEQRQKRAEEKSALSEAIKSAISKKSQILAELGHARKAVLPKSPTKGDHVVGNGMKPHVAGDQCNETQSRLADPSAFTGYQKFRSYPDHLFNGQGDYCRKPDARTRVMIAQTTQPGTVLTIPSRAADKRTEVFVHGMLRLTFFPLLLHDHDVALFRLIGALVCVRRRMQICREGRVARRAFKMIEALSLPILIFFVWCVAGLSSFLLCTY
jgi:hypothetical protein